ncbi:hypothetical protein WN944_003583 [Citrus x changshan-huyou]|uniref:Uncharacterized protein n=1 Tax=Citrus x changshan-huyou TaxID=2935761 RepID=A0AAP0M1W4_9ROSI
MAKGNLGLLVIEELAKGNVLVGLKMADMEKRMIHRVHMVMTTGPKYSFNCYSYGITTPRGWECKDGVGIINISCFGLRDVWRISGWSGGIWLSSMRKFFKEVLIWKSCSRQYGRWMIKTEVSCLPSWSGSSRRRCVSAICCSFLRHHGFFCRLYLALEVADSEQSALIALQHLCGYLTWIVDLFKKCRQLACMVIDMWQEITDVIDDPKKLLIMAILDFHAKKVNRDCRNRAFLVRDHDSMFLNNLEKLLE